MEWVIKGINRKTGLPVEESLFAGNAEEARQTASGRGISVREVVASLGSGASAAGSGGGAGSARGPTFICPNTSCGFKGMSLQQTTGSGWTLFFLSLCGLIPGLLYAIFCCGTIYRCPRCRNVLKL